uniref:SCP2 domain-containing protein n=1 Tax=Brassica oleracea var. oleracea TaxID=109376 RepID=A0A0D2ZUW8_BRAOL
MKQHLSTNAGKELTEKIGLVYQINIAPKENMKEGKMDATFSFKDDDFVKVATGKINPHIAFIRGLMKIKGSLSAAQEVHPCHFPKAFEVVNTVLLTRRVLQSRIVICSDSFAAGNSQSDGDEATAGLVIKPLLL